MHVVLKIGALTLFPLISSAQLDSSLNFYSASEAYYTKHQGKDLQTVKGYKQFKRWEHFNKARCYPSGHPPIPDQLWKEAQKPRSKAAASSASWEALGPLQIPDNGGGMGRVNCIEFNPLNANEVYAGTPDGGLWRSSDGGVSWSSNTDQLVNLGVADIAINPIHPDTMYIATGDGYGYATTGLGFWGGTYSNGVLKSVDGGNSWSTTGLNYDITQTRQVFKISIDNLNPNNLLATTSDGLWLSTDGADSWTKTMAGTFRDVVHHPTNPSIVYSSQDLGALRSTDGGWTWNPMGSPVMSTELMLFAVTPADPAVIAAFSAAGMYFRSNDAGVTWEPGWWTSVTTYNWYAMAHAISPVDANTILVGGVDIYLSTDAGASWNRTSDWFGWPATNYSHADHRALTFVPGSGNQILNGNDGGVFKSNDLGATWVDLSKDLIITQLYRLALDPTDPDIIFAGAQDNGVVRMDGASARMSVLADGMESVVDYNNPSIVYANAQYGRLHQSFDGGITFTDISTSSGLSSNSWVAPLVIHPTDPSIIYYGGVELYELTNGVITNDLSQGAGNASGIDGVHSIAVCESDPDHIYFIRDVYPGTGGLPNVQMTPDGGNTWVDITAGLPVTLAFPTWIAVDPNDPDGVYVTFSGFEASEKVYYSSNGGLTWTNISGTLPNVPVNAIVLEEWDHGVYIGTDYGVYYRYDGTTDWIAYSDGLPRVIVTDLEIHDGVQKLRAATYGRGVWETDLDHFASIPSGKEVVVFSAYPNPTSGTITIRGDFSQAENGVLRVFDIVGREVFSASVDATDNEWSFDLSDEANGRYIIQYSDANTIETRKFIVSKQ